MSVNAYNKINPVIEDLMLKQRVPGLAYAYMDSQGEVHYYTIGCRDFISKERIDINTIFEACSLSKPLFSLYVLIYLLENHISLDDSILCLLTKEYDNSILFNRYTNDDMLKQVTFRHVLSHCSRFPNWGEDKSILSLNIQPGRYFSYSGEAFMLLQELIQINLSIPIEQDIDNKIFKPLGMSNSSFVYKQNRTANIAIGHNELGNKLAKRTWDMIGAASLHTTLSDYFKFVRIIAAPPKEFSPHITNMIKIQIPLNHSQKWNGHIDNDMKKIYKNLWWGLGIGIEKSKNALHYFHWGEQCGYGSFFITGYQSESLLIFCNSTNFPVLRRKLIENLKIDHQHILEWLELG